MEQCDRKCDPADPENRKPESRHYLDCPVWRAELRAQADDALA